MWCVFLPFLILSSPIPSVVVLLWVTFVLCSFGHFCLVRNDCGTSWFGGCFVLLHLRTISCHPKRILAQSILYAMGDAPPARTAIPRMRNAGLSIDTSQTGAQTTQRTGLKLDIRDVVRREGYRSDLNVRAQREEFRGNAREEQRMQRRDAFWNHVNKGVAYSWVNDRGLVVSDEEMELAFKYYRGGGIFKIISSLLQEKNYLNFIFDG
jgi:hypothetical protein